MKSKNFQFFGSENRLCFLKKILLIGIALIVLMTASASATDYYVSTSGSDSNSGISSSQPWKTITKINNEFNSGTFNPGDSILFKRGDTWTSGTYLWITRGGAAGQPLTLGAYGSGNKPVFYGGTHIIGTTDNVGYITIQDIKVEKAGTGSSIYFRGSNQNNITISRVEVIGSEQNAILLSAIDGYIIEDCYVDYAANSGIGIYGSDKQPPISNGVIRNNLVEGCGGNDCFTLHADEDGNDIGSNHLLINNVGHNCAEQAFDITSGKDIILRDNEGYDNADSSVLIGHHAENVWIDRFYSHDERQMGITINEAINPKVTNSIFYKAGYHQITVGSDGGTYNTEIYNNIFVHGPESTGSIIDISYPTTNNVFFKNNIIISMQYDKPSRFVRYLSGATPDNTNSVFSNNIWWRPDGATVYDNRLWYDGVNINRFDWWKARYPTEKLVNPQLVDITNGNLKLKSTSPAIDAGANTGLTYDFENNPRPQGSGYDIGAYEYGSGTPPPPPPPPITGLSWEAEDGVITAPFIISNGYVYEQPGCAGNTVSSCGKASYTFNIDTAGDYIIKTVVDAPTGGANSFFVNIDNEPTDPYMIWDVIDLTNGFEERTVSWRGDGTFDNNKFNPKIFTLSKGSHELIIRGREGGALLDKITLEPYSGSIAGDLNKDTKVNINDLIIVASNFGLTSGGFDERADTDGNEVIDIFDVVFVASRFT